MIRKRIIRLLACFAVITCLLLPAQAAEQKNCPGPILSLLLNNNGTMTFSNDSITLITKTATTEDEKVTKVTDDTGQLILSSTVTTTDITLEFPGIDGVNKMTFPTPLLDLPADSNVSRLAAYIALQISNDYSSKTQHIDGKYIQKDLPGCDGYPDFLESSCILACCARHDDCYKEYDCTAASWYWPITSDDCDKCNRLVSRCILLANNSNSCDNQCYDAKCDMFYDCGASNCECPSPCDTRTSAGQIWLDRNLGASRVAISSTDSEAYGDLYQWGRLPDGHEKRTSPTTFTKSTTNVPGHGRFILVNSAPNDWRTPQNENLWQGVSGTNNPCPSGFRLPTETEFETERVSWGSNNRVGAFLSPLKLPVAGYRLGLDGTIEYAGSYGSYWSSTVNGIYGRRFAFTDVNALMGDRDRVLGRSLRCIQD